MKLKYIFLILFFLTMINIVFGMEGTGSSETPYIVTNCSDFVQIVSLNNTAYYSQSQDFDCINTTFSSSLGTFSGDYDGNLNTIYNIHAESGRFLDAMSGYWHDSFIDGINFSGTTTNVHGLFAYSINGVVRRVALYNVYYYIEGSDGGYAGVWAYSFSGTMDQIYWEGYLRCDGSNGCGAINQMKGTLLNAMIHNGSQTYAGNTYPIYKEGTGAWQILNSYVKSRNYPVRYSYTSTLGGFDVSLNGTYYEGSSTNTRWCYLGTGCPYAGNRKVAADMVNIATYQVPNRVWDTTIWKIENGSYPVLRFLLPQVEVNIEYPTLLNTQTTVAPYFTYNVYKASASSFNCTLYIDDVANITNTSVPINTNFTMTPNVSEGGHNYYISCIDTDGELDVSDTYYYYHDETEPQIYSTSPLPFNTTIFKNTTDLLFYGNVTNLNLTYGFWKINYPNGTLFYNKTVTTFPDPTLYSWDETFDLDNEPLGIWLGYIYANDSLSNYNERNFTFIVEGCNPDWSCIGYESCGNQSVAECNQATDLNSCDLSFTGNYSDFSTQSCTSEVVVSGGGGGGSFSTDYNFHMSIDMPSILFRGLKATIIYTAVLEELSKETQEFTFECYFLNDNDEKVGVHTERKLLSLNDSQEIEFEITVPENGISIEHSYEYICAASASVPQTVSKTFIIKDASLFDKILLSVLGSKYDRNFENGMFTIPEFETRISFVDYNPLVYYLLGMVIITVANIILFPSFARRKKTKALKFLGIMSAIVIVFNIFVYAEPLAALFITSLLSAGISYYLFARNASRKRTKFIKVMTVILIIELLLLLL